MGVSDIRRRLCLILLATALLALGLLWWATATHGCAMVREGHKADIASLASAWNTDSIVEIREEPDPASQGSLPEYWWTVGKPYSVCPLIVVLDHAQGGPVSGVGVRSYFVYVFGGYRKIGEKVRWEAPR